MAISVTTNQQINGTTTVAKNLTNFTMAGWFRRDTNLSLQIFGFNSNLNHRTCIAYNPDNNLYFVLSNASNSVGAFIPNITGWNHVAMVFNGSLTGNSNRLKGYVNGANQSLSFFGTIPSTTSNNVNNEDLRIGRDVLSNVWSTGGFAELGMWQSSLTDGEIVSLFKGMSCDKVRPQSVVYYTPLIRNIQDLSRGISLINTNTTAANHPRVYA